MNHPTLQYLFRSPRSEDGMRVHRLIDLCKPLDPNSVYCNLLQCSHFADTCVLAENDKTLSGFVSAYRLPTAADTLFVWQVAIDPDARGQGLGKRLLLKLLQQPACLNIRYLKTTITESNKASWALFTSLANTLRAEIKTRALFDKTQHFGGSHESEIELCIGTFTPASIPQ